MDFGGHLGTQDGSKIAEKRDRKQERFSPKNGSWPRLSTVVVWFGIGPGAPRNSRLVELIN
jgi:hypothetical protein